MWDTHGVVLARTKKFLQGPAMNRADRPCVFSFFLNKLIFASLALDL